MAILVTGGAGYIGSFVAEALLTYGHEVVVVDDLRQGHRSAVPKLAEFALVDTGNPVALNDLFNRYKIDAVMHMAAETVIEHSMTDPRRYFQTNVVGGMNLLEAMLRHDVSKLIFSSTAAVYGEPEAALIDEEHTKAPVNAYGESKLMFERLLSWYGKAYGMKYIAFRYFNAAGASEYLGEEHSPETHLIPIVLQAALGKRECVPIFGLDHPTKDGSCVRDYVHVVDIARAHVLALDQLEALSGRVYNLGNGEGYSVLQVLSAARTVTGMDIPAKEHPGRPGDPAVLVASAKRASKELGWRPELPRVEGIIETAWSWAREHPNGYAS